MASDYVTSELRNVRIISETDVTGSSIINISKLQERYPTVNDVEFQIIKENNRILVFYEISGLSDNLNNDFIVKSKVLLNNDSIFKNSFGESTSTLGSIYYIR